MKLQTFDMDAFYSFQLACNPPHWFCDSVSDNTSIMEQRAKITRSEEPHWTMRGSKCLSEIILFPLHLPKSSWLESNWLAVRAAAIVVHAVISSQGFICKQLNKDEPSYKQMSVNLHGENRIKCFISIKNPDAYLIRTASKLLTVFSFVQQLNRVAVADGVF